MARRAFDQFAQFFSAAITDIREKLVEEAWFGRTTAPQERMSAEMSDFLGSRSDTNASHEIGNVHDTSDLLPHASLGAKGMSWDDVCDRMSRDNGYQAGVERDIDHEPDR